MNTNDEFELKRALDALPRAIEPPDDAWPGIRAQLKARGRREPGAVLPVRWWATAPAVRIAALLTLLGMSAGALVVTRHSAGTWHLAAEGGSRVFGVGEALATGASRRTLTVGTIGRIEADTATSIRLLEARATAHRLQLDRGTIHAEISAPPRLFVVETPSGTAIDLGCAYTLAVDSAGNSSLVVTAGWVEFTDRGRVSLIPAGFHTIARKGVGVGTPVADDAPATLVNAVRALDASAMSNDSALAIILHEARRADAVTLWHVLGGWRGSSEQRRRVYQRLAALVPPPREPADSAGVSTDPILMRLWWEKLPGTLPIVPGWQRALWTLYLKVTG